MPAPPGREQAGDRRACLAGEGGGAAGVLQTAMVVVPAEQQSPGVRGAVGEPVTAPTIASLVSRTYW
ncbi:hypothetical protein ACWDY4_25865 [Streptomyces olivaceoviridis]